MKLIVKEVFIDKFTEQVYKVGDCLDFDDKKRSEDLVKRGLAEILAESAEPVKKAPRRKASPKS